MPGLEESAVSNRSLYQSLAYNNPISQYVGTADLSAPIEKLQAQRDKVDLASGFVKPHDALKKDLLRKDEIHNSYKKRLEDISNYEDPYTQYRAVRKLGQEYADDTSTGEYGAIIKNHAAYQSHLKELNDQYEKKLITKQQRDYHAERSLAEYEGIGTKDKFGSYNKYNGTYGSEYIDHDEEIDKMGKDWKASGIEGIDPSTGKPAEYHQTQDGMWRKKTSKGWEGVSSKEIAESITPAVMKHNKIVPYVTEQAQMLAYRKGLKGEEADTFINQEVNKVLNQSINKTANKYSFDKTKYTNDENATPEWQYKAANGLDEYAPKITLSNTATTTGSTPISLNNANETIKGLDSQLAKLQVDIKNGVIDADTGGEQIKQLTASKQALTNSVNRNVESYINTEQGKTFTQSEFNRYKRLYPKSNIKTMEQFKQAALDIDPMTTSEWLLNATDGKINPNERTFLQEAGKTLKNKVEKHIEENPISSSVNVLTGSDKQDKDRRTYVDEFSNALTEQVTKDGSNYTTANSHTTVSNLRSQFPEKEGYKIKVSPTDGREFGKVTYGMTVVDKDNKQVYSENIIPNNQGSAGTQQVELGKALMNESKTQLTPEKRKQQAQQGKQIIADALFGDTLYESNIDKQIKLEGNKNKGNSAPFKISDEQGNNYTVEVQKERVPHKSGNGYSIRYKLVNKSGEVVVDSDERNGFANLSDLKISLLEDLHPTVLK